MAVGPIKTDADRAAKTGVTVPVEDMAPGRDAFEGTRALLRRVCAGLLVSTATAALLTHGKEASAQVHPGMFLMNYHDMVEADDSSDPSEPVARDSGDGNLVASTAVRGPAGIISVPDRSPGQPSYTEEWIYFGEHASGALPRDAVIEIVPVGERLGAAQPALAKRAHLDVRIRASATEYDVGVGKEDPRSAGGEAIELPTSDCYVTEIWQPAGDSTHAIAGRLERVGFIRSVQRYEGDPGEQEWLLSSDYTYPSPANGIVTQLRPASSLCSEVAAPPELTITRRIHVRLSRGSPGQEADEATDEGFLTSVDSLAGCSVSSELPAGAPSWPRGLALAFMGVGLAIRRRRRGRRG